MPADTITKSLDIIESNGIDLFDVVKEIQFPVKPKNTISVCDFNNTISDDIVLILDVIFSNIDTGEIMSIHKNISTDEFLNIKGYLDVSYILLLKILFEYKENLLDDMTLTLLCYLEHCNIFLQGTTQASLMRRFIIQGQLFDILYRYNILCFTNKDYDDDLHCLLLKLVNAKQIVHVVSEDFVCHFDAWFEKEFPPEKPITNLLGRVYTANKIKSEEINNVQKYKEHLTIQFESDKSYNAYKPYFYLGGSWMPGRVYAQKVVDWTDNLIKTEYTLKNRALILLWASFVYAYKERTGKEVESFEDILESFLFKEQSTIKPRLTSFMTGLPLVYTITKDRFTIDGGPDYRAIDRWITYIRDPLGDSTYTGCFSDNSE